MHIIVGFEGFENKIEELKKQIESRVYGPRMVHPAIRKFELYDFVISEDAGADLWDTLHTGFMDFPNHIPNSPINKSIGWIKGLVMKTLHLAYPKPEPTRVTPLTSFGVHTIPFGVKEDEHQNVNTTSLREGTELT